MTSSTSVLGLSRVKRALAIPPRTRSAASTLINNWPSLDRHGTGPHRRGTVAPSSGWLSIAVSDRCRRLGQVSVPAHDHGDVGDSEARQPEGFGAVDPSAKGHEHARFVEGIRRNHSARCTSDGSSDRV